MAKWSRYAEELSTSRYPALLAYASLYADSRAAAEDLVHDALLRTFSRPRKLETVGHAEAYVRRAILTTFLDTTRRRATLMRTFARVAERDVEAARVGEIDARDEVETALAALPGQVRACVVLRFYDDLTVAEVASRLGIATGTAKRYLSDGVAALREALGEPTITAGDDDATASVAAQRSSARRAS